MGTDRNFNVQALLAQQFSFRSIEILMCCSNRQLVSLKEIYISDKEWEAKNKHCIQWQLLMTQRHLKVPIRREKCTRGEKFIYCFC